MILRFRYSSISAWRERVLRRCRRLVAHRVPPLGLRAHTVPCQRPTFHLERLHGPAVRHLPVSPAPAGDGGEPDRARLLRAGAAGARARLRRRLGRPALPHAAVPDAAARAAARAHRGGGGGDARVLRHPPADAAQPGRGGGERGHARRHHATAASCSASGSATGRRRTTPSGCPSGGCASSSRSSTSSRRLLEGEAVTAEGHGFRLQRAAARAASPTQAAATADLAGREQRQRGPARRAAGRRLAAEPAHEARRARAPASASTTPSACAAALRRQPRSRSSRSSTSATTTSPPCAPSGRSSRTSTRPTCSGGRARCCRRATRCARPSSELADGGRFIVGGPETCARQVREHVERLGATTFLFRFQWPGMPQELVLASMRRAAEEVFPLLARTRCRPSAATRRPGGPLAAGGRPRSPRRGMAVSGRPAAAQPVQHRGRRDVGDREAAAAGPRRGRVEQALEELELRQRGGERGPPSGGSRRRARGRREAEGGLLDREERGAQVRRDRVEQPVDGGAIGQVGGVDLRCRPSASRGSAARCSTRPARKPSWTIAGMPPSRVDGKVPVGPRLGERHLAQLGGLAELGEQEAHLLGVRRERVVVQHERHGSPPRKRPRGR